MNSIHFLRTIAFAGIGLLPATWSVARGADETTIRDLSPDGRFALRAHEESGPGWVKYHNAEVIALPSRQPLMVIEPNDKPSEHLLWSQDSKRFAIYESGGMRAGSTVVYGFAGASFHEVARLESSWEGAPWPANVHGECEWMHPLRWLDTGTLLLEETLQCFVGANDDNWQAERTIQERFTKTGHAEVQKTKWTVTASPDSEGTETHEAIAQGPGVQPGMPDGFARDYEILLRSERNGPRCVSPNGKYGFAVRRGKQVDPLGDKLFLVQRKPFRILGALEDVRSPSNDPSSLSASWLPDSSAALIVVGEQADTPIVKNMPNDAYVIIGRDGAYVIEIRDGRLARVTDLVAPITDILMADYRLCDPKTADFTVEFAGPSPAIDRDGHVAIECEAVVSPDNSEPSRKEWAARFDAVWSIKDARFVKQKLVRAIGEDSKGWPDGYVIAEHSESPDGQYGVLLPTRENSAGQDDDENTLVNLKTHRRLGLIQGAHYFPGENHRGLGVAWAADSSWCAVTYEGRYGFENTTLVEPQGATCKQTDIGQHIKKALEAVIARQAHGDSPDCYGSAHFRSAPGRKILVRATAYTNAKSLPEVPTYYALFQGTFDLATRKWTRSDARKIDSWDALEFAYTDGLDEGITFSGEEDRLHWYDDRLNDVYAAVRIILPAERFAAVKKEQTAWLKKLEATDSVAKKCELIAARIKELRLLVW